MQLRALTQELLAPTPTPTPKPNPNPNQELPAEMPNPNPSPNPNPDPNPNPNPNPNPDQELPAEMPLELVRSGAEPGLFWSYFVNGWCAGAASRTAGTLGPLDPPCPLALPACPARVMMGDGDASAPTLCAADARAREEPTAAQVLRCLRIV